RVPLRAPGWLERNQVLLFGLTTVPLLATLLSSTDEPLPVGGLAVSAGALLGLATLLVATLVRERLTDPATAPPNFLMTTDLPMIRRAREQPVPRSRVPVLTLLVAGSFAISYAFDSDYYYHRLTRADPALPAGQRVERLRSLVTTWQKKNTPIMTVIAANGGGIQAAAWTARALVE